MRKLDCYMSSCHTLCRYDWMDCINWAHQAGFTGLECFDETEENFSSMGSERAFQLGKRAREVGIALSAHPWVDWAELPAGDMILQFQNVVQRCAEMGVKYLNMHLHFVSDRLQGMERVFRATDACLPKLVDSGIVLLYENVPEYGKRELGSEVRDFEVLFHYYSEKDSVKMNIDTGHAHIMHSMMPLAQDFADRWVYTHINDNDQLKDIHLAPSEGTMDFEVVASLAKTAGYTGPLLMEYNQRGLSVGMTELEHSYGAVGFLLDKIKT